MADTPTNLGTEAAMALPPQTPEQIVIDTCTGAGLTKFQGYLIYAQGLQESGYVSHGYKVDNNFAGMKMPHTRKSPYIAGKGLPAPFKESFPGDPFNFYAHYNSLHDAVLDLLDRHKTFGIDWTKINTVADYITFCTHTHYFQGSAAIYESNVNRLIAKYGQ
jgi:hypothetical protein